MLFDLVGAQRICLITDAMAASGMSDGAYTLGGQDVIVSGRTARLAEGDSIAGGVATMLDVVRWCVQSAGPVARRRHRRLIHTQPDPRAGRDRRAAGWQPGRRRG